MDIKKDKLELLDTDLLKSKKDFDFLYYWLGVFKAQSGWHYPLDLIWLKNRDSQDEKEYQRRSRFEL